MTPQFFRPVEIPAERPPRLFVVVDTEEEFDWSAPFSRDQVSVTAIEEVGRLQDVLAPHGVTPTYVIDYPVASTRSSSERLGGLAERGECRIGAHLHPWVNPPYTEEINLRNSYGCNLGPDLERRKIDHLKRAIADGLGVDARVYKAGRYGFGNTTAATLETLGFDVDVSVNPHWDYTHDGGPSFEGFSLGPGTFGASRRMLELPCTTGYTGAVRAAGPAVHRLASARALASFRAVGILARTGLLNKVMLSPEGSTLDEMRALTAALHGDGLRTFALTFHSPSLKPGCTRYVTTSAERDAFLATIDRYCDYFINELGGQPTTPDALFAELVGSEAPRTPEPTIEGTSRQ